MSEIVGNRLRAGVLAAALMAGGAACSTEGGVASPQPETQTTQEVELPEHVKACQPDKRHELPSATNIGSIDDDRRENIYACMYLLDMGIPFDKPAPLLKVNPETIAVTDFKMRGSLGGWAILGTGALSGDLSAEGSSKPRDIYKLRVKAEDDRLIDLSLDANDVTLKACADPCEPSLNIELPDERLYRKKKDGGWDKDDNTSIWYTPGVDEGYYDRANVEDEDERYAVVSQVSQRLPDEPRKTSVGGGPKSPGEVISVLASSVTLTLPQSVIETQ